MRQGQRTDIDEASESTRPRPATHPRAAAVLSLEILEDRVVPSINIEVNYSLDAVAKGGSGFFQSNPAAITVMNDVAQEMGQRISANLAAIAPGGVNTWTAEFDSPETGQLMSIVNLNVPANTIIVYVGAAALGQSEVGYGDTGGDSWYGYQPFGATVDSRGWSGFAADNGGIWGGSIEFSSDVNWYFGVDPSGLQSDQIDFYSVATHELGHVLGVGTSQQWLPKVSGTYFYGAHAEAVYGGPVPLASSSDLTEWQSGLTYDGQVASEGPTILSGQRVTWTALDEAALEDVGWNAGITVSPPAAPPTVPPVAPPVSPPPVTVPPVVPPVSPPPVTTPPPVTSPITSPITLPPAAPTSPPPVAVDPPVLTPIPVLASATVAGVSTQVRLTYSNGASYAWYPFGSSYKSGVTVALGDVTGNGYPDIIVASGNSGTAGTVQVYDGLSRKLVASYQPYGGFGGGLSVAVGDVGDTGHADIVVGVQGGGWPLVSVLDGITGAVVDQFLAYPTSFLGGVRIAVGDVNGDGYANVVVAPGPGQHGLPVEAYSGQSVATGTGSPQLLGSFVPFAATYTGAVSVAVGDLTSTAYADIVVGTQTSGEKFEVYSGQSMSTTLPPAPLFVQNAWAVADPTGIKVALVSDAAGDGYDDLIVTDGTGTRTARFLESQLTPTGWSTAEAVFFTALPGIRSAVYVG